MAAMGLLISLLSDPLVPINVIQGMNYRDYRKAEQYLLGFEISSIAWGML
jgi:hypothetical protein